MKIMKTLYIVLAWNPGAETPIQLTHFYATTHAEAKEQGCAWRDEHHPELQQLQIRHYPGGFQVVTSRLPGMIEETEIDTGEKWSCT